jgi:hypothetical protein
MLNIFVTLKYLFSKTSPKEAFGILILPNLIIIKKKIKNNIIEDFTKENFTAILTPANPEAYYNNTENFEEIVGIELQYEEQSIS